ncbi:helix-turn-helix domain-containing protein [Paenibacillus sp. GCM10027626]|uniref:helix-turn-helix domain-containing protein n=1 Tax=Paenibacillus sp. GCM10027626 TaxID=3273411 RepID=UPI00362686AC
MATERKQPERLLNESYMTLKDRYKIFKHHITSTIAIHWHEFFEIAFIYEGEGLHILNGTTYPLRRGSLFLLSPADFHEVSSLPGQTLKLYNMIFSERFLREELYYDAFRQTANRQYNFSGALADEIERQFRQIWHEAEEEQEEQFGAAYIVQGALERVIVELARGLRKQEQEQEQEHEHVYEYDKPLGSMDRNPKIDEPIRKSLTFIQHHFREPLTLSDAARQARLSPNYYSECFHRQLGLSFQSYIQELRLEFACALLRISDLPVTDICLAAGFNTLSHFERLFKRKYSRSPRQLRKAAHKLE